MTRVRRANLFVPDAEADIYIVGLGIGGFERRTVEADIILRHSAYIFHLTAFDTELKLAYPNSSVVNHIHLYSEYDDPKLVYEDMANAVAEVASCIDLGRPISFLVYGNPVVLVDSARILHDKAKKIGMRVKIIPAISFLDESISLFQAGLDYAMQYYEATFFVKNEIKPDLRFPVILSQVGDFNSDKLRPDYSSTRFADLYNYIKGLYKSDLSRKIDLYLLPWRKDMEPQVTSYQVRTIHEMKPHVGMSILIHGDSNA